MTACSPRRASGQLNVPTQGWALRDAQHRGGAVRTATSLASGGWGVSAPLPKLWLCPTRASHILRCREASRSRAGGPMPWQLAQPRVGLHGGHGAAGEWRQKVKWGEGGREREAITFSSPIGVGWEAPGRLPKPPGVRGGAAKGPSKETLQSRGWRSGMDRAVPPPRPPESPRSAAQASAEHDPLAQSPSAPSKRLLLLQRVGGLDAPLGITGAGPEPRAQRGWGGGGRPGSEARFEGRCGSPVPRRVLCTPARRFAATSAACRFCPPLFGL